MAINKEITTGTFYIFINLSGNVSGFLQNMPGIYAAFRQFDASIQGLEGKLVLDQSMPNFREVADCLQKQGVDLSEMPPKRPSLFRRDKEDRDDPFTGRR